MTAQEAASAVLSGVLTAEVLIALWIVVDAVLFPPRTRHNLAQLITNAWHTRPRLALSRTRRTRSQGPGN